MAPRHECNYIGHYVSCRSVCRSLCASSPSHIFLHDCDLCSLRKIRRLITIFKISCSVFHYGWISARSKKRRLFAKYFVKHVLYIISGRKWKGWDTSRGRRGWRGGAKGEESQRLKGRESQDRKPKGREREQRQEEPNQGLAPSPPPPSSPIRWKTGSHIGVFTYAP